MLPQQGVLSNMPKVYCSLLYGLVPQPCQLRSEGTQQQPCACCHVDHMLQLGSLHSAIRVRELPLPALYVSHTLPADFLLSICCHAGAQKVRVTTGCLLTLPVCPMTLGPAGGMEPGGACLALPAL